MQKTILLIFFLLISGSCLFSQSYLDVEKYLEGNDVTGIYGTGDLIWVATNGNGIYKYSITTKKWFNYSTSKGNIQHDFFYCITANDDYVWAGSTDGLFILDIKRNRWTKRKFGKGGQLGNWIRSLAYDKYDNCVWIGRFAYLTKYDIAERRFTDYDLTVGGDEKTNTIKAIGVDGDSLVWFGTEGGLHKYDKSKNLDAKNSTVLYNNKLGYFNGEGQMISVSSLLFERKYIWIGVDEFKTEDKPDYNTGGLYRFNRTTNWLRFDTKNGLPANGIFCTERTGNYIWVSVYQFGQETREPFGRGLVLINRLTNAVIPVQDSRIPDTITAMYFDGEDMWLGGNTGLTKLQVINKFAEWSKGN